MLIPVVTFVAGVCELSRLHIVAYGVLLLLLGLMPGSTGPNRFGEDLLGGSSALPTGDP